MISPWGVIHKGPIADPYGFTATVVRATKKAAPKLKKGKLKPAPLRNKYKPVGKW